MLEWMQILRLSIFVQNGGAFVVLSMAMDSLVGSNLPLKDILGLLATSY